MVFMPYLHECFIFFTFGELLDEVVGIVFVECLLGFVDGTMIKFSIEGEEGAGASTIKTMENRLSIVMIEIESTLGKGLLGISA